MTNDRHASIALHCEARADDLETPATFFFGLVYKWWNDIGRHYACPLALTMSDVVYHLAYIPIRVTTAHSDLGELSHARCPSCRNSSHLSRFGIGTGHILRIWRTNQDSNPIQMSHHWSEKI